MTDQRPALHAYVTEEAHDRWHDFASAQGVTVSAFLEAFAPSLNFDSPAAKEPMVTQVSLAVIQARKIDASRRRRPRGAAR